MTDFMFSLCNKETVTALAHLVWLFYRDESRPATLVFDEKQTWVAACRLIADAYGFEFAELMRVAQTGGPFVRPVFWENYLTDWVTLAAWHHCVETLGWKVHESLRLREGDQ